MIFHMDESCAMSHNLWVINYYSSVKIIASYIISLSDFQWQPESNLDRHGVLCESSKMSRESSRDECEFEEDISEQGFGEYKLKPRKSVNSKGSSEINCFHVVECPKTLPKMFIKFVEFDDFNNFQNATLSSQSSIQFTAIDQTGNPSFYQNGFSIEMASKLI